MNCGHAKTKPVPEVAPNGLLTGAVRVECCDCGMVLYDDTTVKLPTGAGNVLISKDVNK